MVGRREAGSGRALIFVVEEVHITILQKQPSLKDPALKSWRPFWARDILGLQRWKGRIDEREGNSFVAFACASQETAAHGHAVHGVQELSKTASEGVQNGSLGLGK